ncbi:hypothetical protein [Natrinema hispanicum]|uniref:hypothetical protein n=1 Tax=Natrinema hispanicum TaxID=392421 RepID=UPI001F5FEF75|nr:hypothetical protein [Natrinema hispanicum]
MRTVPALAASVGPIKGAITIDPTTTAAESSNSPAVATIALTSVSVTYIGIANMSPSDSAYSS